MPKFLVPIVAAAAGAGTAILIIVVLYTMISIAVGHELDEQPIDVYVKPDPYAVEPWVNPAENYDQSDFLKDMNDILRGNYVPPLDQNEGESNGQEY